MTLINNLTKIQIIGTRRYVEFQTRWYANTWQIKIIEIKKELICI